MLFASWSDAAAVLSAAAELVTPKQQILGKQAGISINPATPTIVAAARLRIALAEELALPAGRAVSDRRRSRIRQLRRSTDPPISPKTDEEAEAWVAYLRLVRRRERLMKLKLNAGDVVKTRDEEFAEVSSIDEDGRVHFKVRRGFRSWPDLISVVARKDDTSRASVRARTHAANAAARHTNPAVWSTAKSTELSAFLIRDRATQDDVDELESIITKAKDERPIQEFLNENRQLFAALLGGKEHYCLPLKHLGAEYIPDFTIW